MRLTLIKLVPLTFILLFSSLKAQETFVYAEDNALLKKAFLLVDGQKYLATQEILEQFYAQPQEIDDNFQYINNMYADYYYAYSSYKLDLNNTEKLYTRFINKYHESALRQQAYFDLGTFYFDKKQTGKAIEYYKMVSPRDLSNEDAVTYKFNLGYSYFKKKDFKNAQPLFRDIKNMSSSKYYEPANYYYGFISFYEENYKEAESSFVSLENSDLYKNVIPYYLSQIYFLRKNYQKVIDYTEPLLANSKLENSKEISHIVGQAYFELGQYSKATPLLENYINNVKKVSKEELYQLAYAQYKTEKYTSAIENLLELNIVKDSLGQNAMYILADSYLKIQQKDKARSAFQKAASTEFDSFITEVSTFQYAKLSYELDFTNISIEALTAFLENYSTSSYLDEAAKLLSNALLATKNYSKAVEILETYEVSGPAVDETYQTVTLFRAIELFNDNQFDASLEMINKSLTKNSNLDYQGLALFLKGNIQYEQGQYDKATSNFLKFKQYKITSNSNMRWASSGLADYYIAYSYFERSDFMNAATYFTEVIKTFQNSTKQQEYAVLRDSYLRSADCNFMTKRYDAALKSYDAVIDNKWKGKEYALLQKSIIYGLNGNNDQKIVSLKALVNEYPNSQYTDLAAYELGNAYLQDLNYSAAISQFENFIKKYSQSPYVADGYLKLGLTYYNQGNDNQALASYKKVIQNFPNSQETKEALVALKELYISMGRPNDYIKYVENEAGITISVTEQDSLLFRVVEENYISGNCVKTISSVNEYITSFPAGYFALSAKYYRADCLFKAKEYTKAYPDLKFVIEKGRSSFYETALTQATYIAYEINANYEEANFLYSELYNNAAKTSNKEIAVIGLMRSNFKLKKYDEVLVYANEVLQDAEINEQVKTEAKFYKAKALFEKKRFTEAETYFSEIVATQSISKIKAESAYSLAKILFEKNAFQQSLDACFLIKNEYASYQYWIVKTFILMADNYVKLNNTFQAKATLQSIVDNYDGDQLLLNEAKEKLEKLKELELENTKVDLDTTKSDTIEFDEGQE